MSETVIKPVAFYHRDGLVAAWNHAARYAGKSGHVATLPELIELRLHTKAGKKDSPWETWYTSSSAEYVGVGADGRVKIIVAHGVGPMSTLDGIMAAYKWEYSDRKERRRTGGRITAQQFLDLEAGQYGEVNVVDVDSAFMDDPKQFRVAPVNVLDFQDYLDLVSEEFVFGRHLTSLGAIFDPLIRLRLGPKGYAYIQKHRRIARKFHKESESQRNADREHPYIMQVQSASNCSYLSLREPGRRPIVWDYVPRVPEEGYALAHLLDLDALVELHTCEADVGITLCSSPNVHEWWNGAKFVAVPKGVSLDNGLAAGPQADKVIREHWEHFMQPVESDYVPITPFRVESVGTEWFTRYPKQDLNVDCADAGDVEFNVRSIEPMAGLGTFTVDDMFMLRYKLSQVTAIMPRTANAYEILDISPKDSKGLTTVTVRFYRIDVDTSRRLPRADTIARDYDKLMEVYTH